MDESKGKLIKIGIIIACLVLAIGVTAYTLGGGDDEVVLEGEFLVECTQCGESYSLSRDEFTQKLETAMSEGVMSMTSPPTITCPLCGEATVLRPQFEN